MTGEVEQCGKKNFGFRVRRPGFEFCFCDLLRVCVCVILKKEGQKEEREERKEEAFVKHLLCARHCAECFIGIISSDPQNPVYIIIPIL